MDTKARCGEVREEAIANEVDYEEITDVPAPYAYLTLKVQKGIERQWTEKWMGEVRPDGSPCYRQTKHWFPEPCKGLLYDLIREDRETLGKCMQFITGHARMNRHQNLIDSANVNNEDEDAEVTPPTCRLCGRGEETPFHLVLECEEMRVDSYRYFGNQDPNHNRRNYKFRWKVHKLIAFLANPTLNPLLGLGEPEDDENDEEEGNDAQQTSVDANNSNNDDDNNNENGSPTEDSTMRDLFHGNYRGL